MWGAFVRFVLDVLAVPPEPSPPSGTPGTLKVFRAAEAYYAYRLVLFALRHVAVFAAFGGAFVVTELALHDEGAPPIAFSLVRVIEFAAAGVWLVAVAFGYAMQRLDYEMRWYMVTDRSLRIREGVLVVREMTLTFVNVQNVTVDQGPLQRLLGVADVRVQTAGGGGGHESQGDTMHVGVLRGIADAERLRELVLARMREAGGTGLGDPDEPARPPTIDAAARELLEQARAFSAVAERLSR